MPGRGSWRKPAPTVKTCTGCGEVSDAPTHTVLGVDLAGGQTVEDWHYGCHAPLGCEVCAALLEQ